MFCIIFARVGIGSAAAVVMDAGVEIGAGEMQPVNRVVMAAKTKIRFHL